MKSKTSGKCAVGVYTVFEFLSFKQNFLFRKSVWSWFHCVFSNYLLSKCHEYNLFEAWIGRKHAWQVDLDTGYIAVSHCHVHSFHCCSLLQGCYYLDQKTQNYTLKNNAGPGVNETDFILYIASIQSNRCRRGRTVAYAAHCQQERALDRSVDCFIG